MSKKLYNYSPLYIASGIKSEKLDAGGYNVIDEKKGGKELNVRNLDDKIYIYEREVKGWFLNCATRLSSSFDNGLIVLMICFAYLEGVEQYKEGSSSKGKSKDFFVSSIKKIYPNNNYTKAQIEELYDEAQCGLFHDGMVKGKVIFGYGSGFSDAIFFGDNIIKINPEKLLSDVKKDFNNFLNKLRNYDDARAKFNRMYFLE